MPLCCPNCFNDIGLKEYITLNGKNDVCSYCGSARVHCIEPGNIRQLFEFFSYGIQRITDGEIGYTYSDLIQNNFSVFSNIVKNAHDLTNDILGEDFIQPIFRLNFDPSKHSSLWNEFKDELKYTNRFFPTNSLYSSLFTGFHKNEIDGNFSALLGQLTKPIYSKNVFYRARISDNDLNVDDMKMPPKGLSSGGRANPVGISYLYLASNLETCIAEVRPSNSSRIQISKFTLTKDMNVLDLTSPRCDISATVFEGDEIEDILNYVNLLETLSLELSKPILPDKSIIDYIPTQFLCEFIKSVGSYDGIIFNSSFGHGVNFVFFSQENFIINNPESYSVTKTSHEYIKH